MILSNLLSITTNAYLSAAIWALVILVILYLARGQFHRTVLVLGHIVYRAMRLLAAATLRVDRKLARRNRRVLIAFGRAHSGRILEREFERIHSAVVKNLEGYPRAHRRLSEMIARLEDDYARSADAPPSLPDWIPVIQSIADIDCHEGTQVAHMLGEIHHSLSEQQKSAVDTYRRTTAQRHRILSKWMPLWRRIRQHLRQTDKKISQLSDQAESVDRRMDEFETLAARLSAPTIESLQANAWKQFFLSALMLTIFSGAGYLNFQLLSASVGTMISAADWLGPFTAAQTTALTLVSIEIGLGVCLMESLRVTRVFPAFGGMKEVVGRRFAWMSALLLTTLAGLQGLLIYLVPAADAAAARPAAGSPSFGPIHTVMPAVLGVILPVVLILAAIPLETFATTARTVAGFILRAILGLLAVLFRLTGSLAGAVAKLAAACYDIVIFPAVWLEDAVGAGRKPSSAGSNRKPAESAPPFKKAASDSSES